MSKVIDLLTPNYNYYPYVRKTLFPVIVQAGVGGTGSNLVPQIAQMLTSFGDKAMYVLADGDQVEEKNLKNQLYVSTNIGKSKADILAKRYRAAYNINIGCFNEYIEDLRTLRNLFSTDYVNIGGTYREHVVILPILISCVDNNFSRQLFHEFFESVPTLLYIDVGNESAVVPKDFMQRPKDKWTKEEIEAYNESGWTGQVVAGLKRNGKTILEPVASLYPDILEDQDTIKPSTVSCEQIVSSDPQRLLTNKTAALAVLNYLYELMECGTISKHKTVFHAKKGYMQSVPLPEETPTY
ncbi:ThiF family adenylyltransferase [Bacillus salitolerans]|uniref:ThiF family adenylyltransferase n=1 Tax=Bacillus salitolerans TaxID=1437434 RepID=A0ABW4LM37_9BACI